MEIKTFEDYDRIILAEPKESEIKTNPDGSLYLPITIVQDKLYSIYGGHTKLELIRETLFKDGLAGVGRLHYKHPVSGEWLFQDGSAAFKYKGVLRLDFPSLGGHILLNCAKKIGPCFGQKLNRDREDAPVVEVMDAVPELPKDQERLITLMADCKTMEQLTKFKQQAFDMGLSKYFMHRITELEN